MNNYNEIIEACSYLLYNSPIAENALNYLDNRLDRSTQTKFEFGFFPSDENLNQLFSIIDENILYETKLVYEKTIHDGISRTISASSLNYHNLILPYRNLYGEIIAIVGRTLLSETQRSEQGIAKYKNTAFEKSKHLFGLYEAKEEILKKNYVFVCEGQFDCIQAHANRLHNVVAVGSSNLSSSQLALLLRYTNRVGLVLDNDDAGKTGIERILSKFGKYANFEAFKFPEGVKDLDEFMKIGNREDLLLLKS